MYALYNVKPTSKAITAFADYSGTVAGTVQATSVAHGLPAGTTAGIAITGTTNYNGTYTVTYIDVDSFYFTDAWVANDATGWWGVASEGRYNIGVGYAAGDNITTGSNNLIIGYNVDAPSATADNQLNIGNAIYGNLSTGNVGIGVTTPSTPLHVKVSNTETTIPQIYVEQDSTGDASIELGIVGDSYIMGIDNSDSDTFAIAYSSTQGGGVLGTNNRLTISSGGAVDVVGGFTANTITSDSTLAGTALTLTDSMKLGSTMQTTRDAHVIADAGTPGTPTPYNLTPASMYVSLNCQDADGCDITFVETGGILDGMIFNIINISANACNFADVAGVQSVNGASITLGQIDMVSFMYTINQYTELTPVSNN